MSFKAICYTNIMKKRVCKKVVTLKMCRNLRSMENCPVSTEWKSQNLNPGLDSPITDILLNKPHVSFPVCIIFRLLKLRDRPHPKWQVWNLTALKNVPFPCINYSGHIAFNCSLIFLLFLGCWHSKDWILFTMIFPFAFSVGDISTHL